MGFRQEIFRGEYSYQDSETTHSLNSIEHDGRRPASVCYIRLQIGRKRLILEGQFLIKMCRSRTRTTGVGQPQVTCRVSFMSLDTTNSNFEILFSKAWIITVQDPLILLHSIYYLCVRTTLRRQCIHFQDRRKTNFSNRRSQAPITCTTYQNPPSDVYI